MTVADPGRFALKGAIRAAIVMPAAFALGEVVLDDPQAGLFAAFGSIAVLVFVDFGGSWRTRLTAFLGLGIGGAGLIALGTLCSHSTALGAAAMFAIGFGVLFAGVLNGYVAAAQSASILAFVLAVMVPAQAAEIPHRLLGWAIAVALATAAVLLLWPGRPRSVVRNGAARSAQALAELLEAKGEGERREAVARARAAVAQTRRDFVSMQHRPSGTGGRTAALARLIEDLGWLIRFAEPPREAVRIDPSAAAAREQIERSVPVALRELAGQLAGSVPLGRADGTGPSSTLAELRSAHDRLGRATLAQMQHLAGEGRGAEAEAGTVLEETFRLRLLSFLTEEASIAGRRALGARTGDAIQVARARFGAARRVARAHASMRSVWLRNSLRGALGLALAVLIGQLADIQHGFWVVLGTLSVLRSSALATGATIWQALLGTFTGILVGGLLVIAVGTDTTALWILLPFATALAAYSPRAVSFAAGQAGFSIVVLILFNLIDPTGWKVGLLRIEDVAIGAGISLLVGLLLWPRGAVSVLRREIGAAYASAASFLGASVAALLEGGERPRGLAREAFIDAQLLDGGLRDYLSDRSGANAPIEELAILMSGAARVREVASLLANARVLAAIEPVDPRLERVQAAAEGLAAECRRRSEWFDALGTAVAERSDPPAAEPSSPAEAIVLDRLPGEASVPPGMAIAWARRYLDALRELESGLARAAAS